jgi:hypothetical protein
MPLRINPWMKNLDRPAGRRIQPDGEKQERAHALLRPGELENAAAEVLKWLQGGKSRVSRLKVNGARFASTFDKVGTCDHRRKLAALCAYGNSVNNARPGSRRGIKLFAVLAGLFVRPMPAPCWTPTRSPCRVCSAGGLRKDRLEWLLGV